MHGFVLKTIHQCRWYGVPTTQATTEAHEEASALQRKLRAQQAELTQATARADEAVGAARRAEELAQVESAP